MSSGGGLRSQTAWPARYVALSFEPSPSGFVIVPELVLEAPGAGTGTKAFPAPGSFSCQQE